LSLLKLEAVTVRRAGQGPGARERIPVSNASLEVDEGETVAVVGRGRSGRSTLLRVAAGMERPSEGRVTFAGKPLVGDEMLGVVGGIGYCHNRFSRVIGTTVLDHVAASILTLGLGASEGEAEARAISALRRCKAESLAHLDPLVLDLHEAARVSIARAVVSEPRLLLVDDAAYGVDLGERDEVLRLVHSFARVDGRAVLFSVSSGTELAGADRAISIDAGMVRGELRPRGAQVRELPTRWRRRRS
jgi:ABC-type cobalamin/Fe3+-siderophores transport system ATPase subunit